MKVKDLIQMEIDVDVYDDVCEELGIAFCGPQPLTKEGAEHFAEVLDYDVTIHNYSVCPVAVVSVDDPDESVFEAKLGKAKEFFEAMAGYCACDDYDRWFGEEGQG